MNNCHEYQILGNIYMYVGDYIQCTSTCVYIIATCMHILSYSCTFILVNMVFWGVTAHHYTLDVISQSSTLQY